MTVQSTTPYETESPSGDASGRPSRYATLAAAAGAIRVRRGGRIPVEQILLVAAAILFPLGLVIVLLGWEGAAHNGHTYAQIDYLISGGIFGLGVSVAGGFMYFGYWLSRQIAESRRQNTLTVQALQRLEDLLDFAVNSRAGTDGLIHPMETGPDGAAPSGRVSPPRRTARRHAGGPSGGARAEVAVDDRPDAERPTGEVPAVSAGARNGAVLFATPRGTLLHRPECPVVSKRNDLKVVEAKREGYGYCTMCGAAGAPA